MSQRPKATVSIEWSPRYVRAFDNVTRQEQTSEELSHLTALAGKHAIIGVSRRSLFVRTTRVPDTDPTTVRQILGMRITELFPVGVGEVAFDYLPLSDVTPEGRLALIVAIPTGELRRIRAEARHAGIKIDRVVPIALGSAILARSMGLHDAAVVSAEAGGFGIDIVSAGEIRHSRSVNSNAALEAEVNRTYSVADLSNDAVIVEPGIDYSSSAIPASMSTMEALLHEWPNGWDLNLELPEELAAHQKAEVRAKMRTALVLAAAAVALLLFSVNDYMERADKVRIQVSKAEAPLRKLKSIQKQAEADASQQETYTKVVSQAFTPAQELGDVLAMMSNYTPKEAWLTGMSVERGKPVIFRGTAMPGEAVTTFVRSLNDEDRFREVQLVFANNAVIDQTPVVQFSISAFPVGNVPVIDKSTKSKRTASR